MQGITHNFFLSRGIRIGITSALAVVIASSWLLFIFVIDGKSLLNKVKFKLQQGGTLRFQAITSVLSRPASLSEHVDLLAIYATPEFFAAVGHRGRSIPYSPEKSLLFIINEDTHIDALSRDPTPAVLRVDGRDMYRPERSEMLSYSTHHKVSVVSFPKQKPSGQIVVDDRTRSLEILVPKQGSSDAVVLRWKLPITYPEQALRGQTIPLATTLALAAGLLATVLTPCLIQLILYYLSTLTGMGVEMPSMQAPASEARSRLLRVALGFVSGFAVLFTGVGALAGFAGETLQGSGLWLAWTRPLAIAAGVVIVLLGLWTAIRAKAPLVCRLSLPKIAQAGEAGFFRSTLMGFSFAVGCSTCFGGALIATLLLYVGTLGSAMQGALVLFLFSLGVGIPFLLAAVLLSRVLPFIRRVERVASSLGLISSLVMIGFGLLLITDNFHLVSSWIYLWLLS